MSETRPDLSDQNVLISGAGRGLGRSLALHLSRCGAVVGVSDIDEETCRQTAADVRNAGGVAHAYPADLSSQAAFAGIAAAFAKNAGRIDAVVNNAAFLRYQPIDEVTENTVDLMLGAGFKSAVWGAQALLKHMDPERGGGIINMSSPLSSSRRIAQSGPIPIKPIHTPAHPREGGDPGFLSSSAALPAKTPGSPPSRG